MEHSRKPDEIHDRIERLVPGPYLELYARRERHNWITWGDEIASANFANMIAADDDGVIEDEQTRGEASSEPASHRPLPSVTRNLKDDSDLNLPDFLRRASVPAGRGG